MSNQNYEIVKNSEGRYDLIVNGQFVKSYSRKADAPASNTGDKLA